MRIYLLLLLTVVIVQAASACDFCNNLHGINPLYNENNRLMIHFLSQRSTLPAVAANDAEMSAVAKSVLPQSGDGIQHHGEAGGGTETRKTIELAYQYHLFTDVLVTASIPFTMTEMTSSQSASSQGLGDATLLALYVLPLDDGEEEKSITVLLGGGIKLPTGKSNFTHADGTRYEQHLQLGSGSTDFILNSIVISQFAKWTFAFDAFGKINSSNSFNDKTGNSLSLSLLASHDLYRKNSSLFAIIGTFGIRTELSARDKVAGAIDGDSGFANTYANLGAQFVYDWLRLDISLLAPFIQNRSERFAQEKARLLGGVRFEF
jgi:hypothetical protein